LAVYIIVSVMHGHTNIKFFSENQAVYEIMWKNIVQPDRPQMTIQYGACPMNAGYSRRQKNTQNTLLIVSTQQKWLSDSAPILTNVLTLPPMLMLSWTSLYLVYDQGQNIHNLLIPGALAKSFVPSHLLNLIN